MVRRTVYIHILKCDNHSWHSELSHHHLKCLHPMSKRHSQSWLLCFWSRHLLGQKMAPATHMGVLDGVPGSQFCPGSALDVAVIWKMNHWLENSLSPVCVCVYYSPLKQNKDTLSSILDIYSCKLQHTLAPPGGLLAHRLAELRVLFTLKSHLVDPECSPEFASSPSPQIPR